MRHLKHLFLETVTLLLLCLGTAAGCFAAVYGQAASPAGVRHRWLWAALAALGLLGALLTRLIDRRYRRKGPHRVRTNPPHPAPGSSPVRINPLATLPPARK